MWNKIREIFAYRELIANLVIRDLKVKYRNSILGYLWSLLDPLLTTLLFIVVFSIIVRIPVKNYPVFLITAILPWGFLQGSLLGAVESISGNANLIKKTYFPRQIFPLSSILSNTNNFVIILIVFLPLILFFNVKIGLSLAALPLVILLQLSLLGGLALFTSLLNAFFTDIAFALRFALNVWFYATPIFYPPTMVPQKLMKFYMLNPMAVIVSIYRWAIIHTPLPELKFIIIAAGISFGLFFSGFLFFKKKENTMIKRL
jgi:ABC-type polysaccharide/polyol phosphate export permease